jgi:hypothetical protein
MAHCFPLDRGLAIYKNAFYDVIQLLLGEQQIFMMMLHLFSIFVKALWPQYLLSYRLNGRDLGRIESGVWSTVPDS